MSDTTRPGAELRSLLNDLVSRVPEARDAVLLTEEGLLLAASEGMSRSDAEHLAALASGYQSLSRGAGRVVSHGQVRQTIVEMEKAFLFVTSAGHRALLAMLSSAGADMGQLVYEIALLVQKVEPALSVAPRHGLPEPETAS